MFLLSSALSGAIFRILELRMGHFVWTLYTDLYMVMMHEEHVDMYINFSSTLLQYMMVILSNFKYEFIEFSIF